MGGQESTRRLRRRSCFVKSHQALNKNGETRRWIIIHKVACRCLLKIEEECQTRTERPVGGQESTKVEELDIDFRLPGLSHSVVREAEHLRFQDL